MKNGRFVLFSIMHLAVFLLSLNAVAVENDLDRVEKRVVITSLDSLMAFFDELDYNNEAWQRGSRKVPRLMFNNVSKKWQTSSKNLPVKTKKAVFFRLMAPLVLMSNEAILKERELIQSLESSDPNLRLLFEKYRVELSADEEITVKQRANLLTRVDIVPPSLALAQAAEESGWATSRFTIEGNAFFGQWDFSGQGMVPKQQRKELGNYGIAKFDSPIGSVMGYMQNINTSFAYDKFRKKRAELRANNQLLSGWLLAATLDKYSERGQAYIDSIRSMIDYNKLQQVDEAYLDGEIVYRLITE